MFNSCSSHLSFPWETVGMEKDAIGVFIILYAYCLMQALLWLTVKAIDDLIK